MKADCHCQVAAKGNFEVLPISKLLSDQDLQKKLPHFHLSDDGVNEEAGHESKLLPNTLRKSLQDCQLQSASSLG